MKIAFKLNNSKILKIKMR